MLVVTQHAGTHTYDENSQTALADRGRMLPLLVVTVSAVSSLLLRSIHHDTIALILAVSAATLAIYLNRANYLQITAPIPVDELIIAALLIASAIGLSTSIYTRNSCLALTDAVFLTCIYFAAKKTLAFRIPRLCWYIAFSVLSLCVSLEAIVSSAAWASQLYRVGFYNVTQFRNSLQSVGLHLSSGEMASVALVLAPFPFITTWAAGKNWLCLIAAPAAAVGAVLFTFSRGAYMGLLAFLITLALAASRFPFPARKRAYLQIGSAVTIAFGLAFATPLNKAVWATCKMGNSEAHERSVQGRYETWRTAVSPVREHLMLGIGAGNYSLFQSSSGALTMPQAFNTVLQVTMEDGLLILAPTLVLVALFYYRSARMLSKHGSVAALQYPSLLCAAGVTGLLVRDLTYSSLLTSPTVIGIFVTLLAHNFAVTEIIEE
jgi:hypothetical protein